MSGFCKERRLDDARKLFDEMPERWVTRNQVAYSTMIEGLCKAGDLEGAFSVRE